MNWTDFMIAIKKGLIPSKQELVDNYLPKSGGTVTAGSRTPLKVNNSVSSKVAVGYFNNDTLLGEIGVNANKPFFRKDGTETDILHTGNAGDYAITKSNAGTQTIESEGVAPLFLKNILSANSFLRYQNTEGGGYLGFRRAVPMYVDGSFDKAYELLHSGNVGNYTSKNALGVRSHAHDSVDCTAMTIPQLKSTVEAWANSDAVNCSDFNVYTTRVGQGFINIWNSGDTTSVCGWGGWWYWCKIGADTSSNTTRFLVSGYGDTEIYYVTLRSGVWSNLTPLLHTGNVGNYAVPLNGGGTVHGAVSIPLGSKSDSGNNCYYRFEGTSGKLGSLGFAGVDNPVMVNGAGNAVTTLLHTGNSASVKIQSSAPTDTSALWVW